MKPRVYEQRMPSEKGAQMLYSDLFVKIFSTRNPIAIIGPNGINMPGYEERVISIQGTNGHIYTGFYIREDSMGRPLLHEGTNLVKLGFRFGDKQSTRPLDDKVAKYGFGIRR